MAYFPLFFDLTQKRVLLIGGGRIAAEKLAKLLDFTRDITVIAASVTSEVDETVTRYGLTLKRRAYRQGDIDGFDIVVVATDTVALHRQVYEESRGKGILVNSVDDTRYCDFIFPSYIKQGDLTIAFSTSGASPAFAKALRRYIEAILPEGIDDFLTEMKRLRTTLPKGETRRRILSDAVRRFFDKKEDSDA